MKTQTITQPKQGVHTMIIYGLLFLMVFCTQALTAQSTERTVSGVVKTYEGVVPGAAIYLKGTTVGIAADDEGAFTFPKPLKENDVLVISSMAFDDIEVTITGNTAFIEPYLEANPVTIIGALRTSKKMRCANSLNQ